MLIYINFIVKEKGVWAETADVTCESAVNHTCTTQSDHVSLESSQVTSDNQSNPALWAGIVWRPGLALSSL